SGWSWSPFFLDVDLDGYEDIIISTGHFHDALDADALNRVGSQTYMTLEAWQKQILIFPELQIPNVAFRNRGNLQFENMGENWGFASTDITNGMALGDLDNDGDLDIVANRFDAPAGVYRNESTTPRLTVRLRGLPPNTQGIGAKILVTGGPVQQSKEVISAGTYLSSSDTIYMFACGDEGDNLKIEVNWRSGKKSLVENVKANRVYEIYELGQSQRTGRFLIQARILSRILKM
ncbi:MAG: ASPIC/UnbV domain-containing protein, partial [bacterium]